eukprot:CAMPEP_0195275572 /NCGR_PEP_ID=MMETSP0706-20130129/17948_1 /TAXON_ID=33640 /ORGANISM="Asterionellopsis glacialis, Strain CCMP134" /LENGTH=39 /DNA_ID= /DNA_START= /DNA_END= /DNA_ORIENTATION=
MAPNSTENPDVDHTVLYAKIIFACGNTEFENLSAGPTCK